MRSNPIRAALQTIIYKLRVILSGASIVKKLIVLLGMIFVYLLIFGSLYYTVENIGSGSADWRGSLKWATKHLIDPGFIADDMDDKQGGLPIIILGVISILFGLLCFMVVLLTTVHDLGARFLRKVSHGVLPPHLEDHLIIIGHSEQVITYFENESLLTQLFEETSEVVFVLTDEGALKHLSEYDIDRCHLFEITESDLRMGHSDLQTESARQVLILKGKNKDMGLRIRFIDQILEERLRSGNENLKRLKLVVENASYQSEQVLYTLISGQDLIRANVDLQVVDHTKIKARSLLLEQRLDHKVYTQETATPPLILIDGWSQLSAEIVKQVRSFGLYTPDQVTPIVILYRSERDKQALQSAINKWIGDEHKDEYYQQLGITHIEYLHVDDLGQRTEAHCHSALLVSGEDDNIVISHALDWSTMPLFKEHIMKGTSQPPKLSLYADISEDSPYRYEKYTQSRLRFKLCPSRAQLTSAVIKLDAIPRITHEEYLKKTEEAGKRKMNSFGDYEKSTHRSWDLLDQEVKSWNRSTADHLGIKLSYLAHAHKLPLPLLDESGHIESINPAAHDLFQELIATYDQAREISMDTFTQDGKEKRRLNREKYQAEIDKSKLLKTLECLSKWEHDRWSSERYIHGWREGVSGLKRHPNLVEYKDLDEGTMAYDRDNIIEQLRFRLDVYNTKG